MVNYLVRCLRSGDLAPDFELPSCTGKSVRLSNLRGKNVVLYFYPNVNTPGCIREACGFRDSYNEFNDLNVEILAVSSDKKEDHSNLSKKFEIPFNLLSDQNSKVKRIYNASSFFGLLPKRITYVIDKNGVIRHIFSSQIRLNKHVTSALEAVKKLR